MNCLWVLILLFCCGNNNGRNYGRNNRRNDGCNNVFSNNGSCECNREREKTCERECSDDRENACERENTCGCVEPRFEARPFMSFGNTTCGCEMTQNTGCECRQ